MEGVVFMIVLADVKDYLRIPQDLTEDDVFLNTIIEDGYDYLRDAVDDFDEIYNGNELFARKADRWVLNFHCPTAYEEREGMGSGAKEMGYASRALITQLSLYGKAGS
jgi:hypothetical protein